MMITINLGDLIADIILIALLFVSLLVILFIKLGELLSKRNDDDIKYYCENDIKASSDIADYLLERSKNDAEQS